MNWLRKTLADWMEFRVRTAGLGFPGAPDSIRRGQTNAPLGDPIKFRKIYRGNIQPPLPW